MEWSHADRVRLAMRMLATNARNEQTRGESRRFTTDEVLGVLVAPPAFLDLAVKFIQDPMKTTARIEWDRIAARVKEKYGMMISNDTLKWDLPMNDRI